MQTQLITQADLARDVVAFLGMPPEKRRQVMLGIAYGQVAANLSNAVSGSAVPGGVKWLLGKA
jgi:hypothetical protein